MYLAAAALKGQGVEPELLYLGNLRRPLDWMQAIRLVRNRAVDYDIIHSQFGSAAAAVTAFAPDARRVVSLRGSDWTPTVGGGLARSAHAAAASTMSRASLGRYDLAVCVSQRIARSVLISRPSTKVMVLPDPIDTALFHPVDRALARRQADVEDHGGPLVLFTALDRKIPNKRVELALAGVNWARREVPEIELLIATGRRFDEMPAVVASCDVALCTSIDEGWPNAIKEALACNIPFVATDVSDLATLAAREPTCVVVPPTPEAIGRALVRAIRGGPPENLPRLLDDMTMEAFGKALLAAYQGLL